MKKAIVLVTGGLHSTTALAVAADRGYEIYALSFDFGAKGAAKLAAAKKQAEKFGVKEHKVVQFNIDQLLGLGEGESPAGLQLPARNNLYLSFALSWAEVLQVDNIYVGVSSIEFGDNPDCRPAFIHSFEKHANTAVKKQGGIRKFDIWSPLMNAPIADVIKRGAELGVDFADTVTCQEPDENGHACGECISCEYRKEGFEEAGLADPVQYQ